MEKVPSKHPYWISFTVITLLLAGLFSIQQCGIYGRRHGPTAWHRIQRVDYQQPPYANYLQGLSFCLDPGHGGDAHIPNYKRGPTGVREAEMNLRVAFYLKEFLEQAGANVILTRNGDYDISLKERADLANRAKVDMFISLHHNAVDNPHVNYASTWYHADADYSPVSLDLARYIQQSLVDILRLPNYLPTGLLSDYLMYPDGFGVLRYLDVPGILLESSFFSNPIEEKLLAKPIYNRLEAYAIFLGIARWAAAGIPHAELISPPPNSSIADKQPTISLKLSDGLHQRRGAWMLPREQIFSRQVSLFLDDSLVPSSLIREKSLLWHTPAQPLANGWHKVRTELVNYYGNHNLPHNFYFRIAPPATRLIVTTPLPWLPADGYSHLPLSVTALDGDGAPVADDDTIFISAGLGKTLRTARATRLGTALHYLIADSTAGVATILLHSGQATMQRQIPFKDTTLATIQGWVTSNDTIPLAAAKVTCLTTGDSCLTNADGFFLFPRYYPAGDYLIKVQKPGYWDGNQAVQMAAGKSSLLSSNLSPLFAAALHDFQLVIDAAVEDTNTVIWDGKQQPLSTINLHWAQMLKTLFEQAGATVYLVNPSGKKLNAKERVAISNQFKAGGYYLRLSLGKWAKGAPILKGGFYAGSEEAHQILCYLDSLLQTKGIVTQAQIKPSSSYEIVYTNRSALSLELNICQHPSLMVNDFRALTDLSWLVFDSFLQNYYPATTAACELKIAVQAAGQPLPYAKVCLQHQLIRYTDQNGWLVWRFLESRTYNLSVADSLDYLIDLQPNSPPMSINLP
jgi:N-acetylmuramoyl-L-alanine amidase